MIRKLILLAFILGLSQSVWAVPALVVRCPSSATLNGGNNSGTTVTCIFPSNTAGNMLFIVGIARVSGATLTIADTATNTWTTVQADVSASCGANSCTTHTWAAYNNKVSAGSNTVTLTSNTSANDLYVGGAEYSGLDTGTALDQTVSATGNSTTPNSGNVTTTVSSELFIGVSIGGDGSVTLSAGTNIAWAMEQKTVNGTVSPGWEDFIASSMQTVSANFTYSAGTNWRSTIFTFKVPSAAGGGASKKKKVLFY